MLKKGGGRRRIRVNDPQPSGGPTEVSEQKVSAEGPVPTPQAEPLKVRECGEGDMRKDLQG